MKCFSKNKIEWLSTNAPFIKHIVFWRRRKRAPALPRSISALCVSRVKFQGHLRVGVVYALIQYLKQQRQKWLMNWWQTLTFVNCSTSNEHHLIGTICSNSISSEGEKKLDTEELTKEGKYNDSFFFKNYTLFTITSPSYFCILYKLYYYYHDYYHLCIFYKFKANWANLLI